MIVIRTVEKNRAVYLMPVAGVTLFENNNAFSPRYEYEYEVKRISNRYLHMDQGTQTHQLRYRTVESTLQAHFRATSHWLQGTPPNVPAHTGRSAQRKKRRESTIDSRPKSDQWCKERFHVLHGKEKISTWYVPITIR